VIPQKGDGGREASDRQRDSNQVDQLVRAIHQRSISDFGVGLGQPIRSLIPLSLGEAAEGDEPNQRDDQSPPEAPDDDQDDPKDHEDPAEADPADAFICHPFSLLGRNLRPAGLRV
jgi:hypothetical protein